MVESVLIPLPSDTVASEYLRVAGVTVPVDPTVISPAIRTAMIEGRYEAREARQIAGIVEPGDRVMEIGAGIGFISTLLSRERRVASVLAIEANPHLLGYMALLHRRNNVKKVRRLNAVLTNSVTETTATFYLRRDFWMGSLAPEPNAYTGKVDVATLNFSKTLREDRTTLIVCDVEGAEATLFNSADLRGVDRILVEVHDHVTGLSGVGALFATLGAKGFAYDPRHSDGSVVLFRRMRDPEVLRPYRD